MKPKVLLTISWHEGIPDGYNELTLIRDDFDLFDEKQAMEEIKEALLEYGATDIEFTNCFLAQRECYLKAKIEKKNPYLPEHLTTNKIVAEQNVNVQLEMILEHRGRYFALEEKLV